MATVSWLEVHASRLTWFFLGFVVLAGSVAIVIRAFEPKAPVPSSSPDRTWDVTGLRLALDASAAPRLLAALERAVAEPVPTRLSSIAKVLLDARDQWRLAALDATKPLPEPKADKLFDAWAADVRKRFASKGRPSLEDAYRSSGLLVVCLHVQTSEEIPDATPSGADAVARTLAHLSSMRTDIRQVDLWSSSEPLSSGELTELDRTLVHAETPSMAPEDVIRY